MGRGLVAVAWGPGCLGPRCFEAWLLLFGGLVKSRFIRKNTAKITPTTSWSLLLGGLVVVAWSPGRCCLEAWLDFFERYIVLVTVAY